MVPRQDAAEAKVASGTPLSPGITFPPFYGIML